jgi:hypothetical protein
VRDIAELLDDQVGLPLEESALLRGPDDRVPPLIDPGNERVKFMIRLCPCVCSRCGNMIPSGTMMARRRSQSNGLPGSRVTEA